MYMLREARDQAQPLEKAGDEDPAGQSSQLVDSRITTVTGRSVPLTCFLQVTVVLLVCLCSSHVGN